MCCDAPPHKRNWRLYHLLDLIPPATPKQVKWSFRKVTLRHHYYQAYLVLYNRARKCLYDSLGEEGYGFIASGTWGPMITAFGCTASVIIYSIVMLIEVALLLIFFAFLGARDDGVLDWSWEKIIAPLMAFVCVMVITTIAAMIFNFCNPRTRREGMSWIDRVSPIGNFLASCAYFVIPFVIGVSIKDDTHAKDGQWLKIMAAPIVGDGLYYLTSFIWRWPRRIRLQMTVSGNDPSSFVYVGIFIMGILQLLCCVAQWILIGVKLDKMLNRSWYIIFIPFCFRAGFRIFEALLRSLMKHSIGVRSSVGVAFDTLGSFFTNGILLISLYFVAVRIERGKRKVRLPHALIPVYIVLGYIFLCLIFTLIYLLCRHCRNRRVESRSDANWVPPQERVGLTVGGGDLNRPVNGPDTSDTTTGPIPSVTKDEPSRRWDALDDAEDTSSAAFPEDLDDNDVEYDDFFTDEEEQLFPPDYSSVSHSPREAQEPYGSPQDDERSMPYSHDVRTTPSRSPVRRSPRLTPHSRGRTPESQRRARAPPSAPSRTGEEASIYSEETSYMDDEEYSYTEQTTYLDEEYESYYYSYTEESQELDSWISDASSSVPPTSTHDATPRSRSRQ